MAEYTHLHHTITSPGDGIGDLVRFLSQGTDLNAADSGGHTPLMVALKYRKQERALTLLAHGSDPSQTNNSGWNAFHWAASTDDEKLLTALAQHVCRKRSAEGLTETLAAMTSSGKTPKDMASGRAQDWLAQCGASRGEELCDLVYVSVDCARPVMAQPPVSRLQAAASPVAATSAPEVSWLDVMAQCALADCPATPPAQRRLWNEAHRPESPSTQPLCRTAAELQAELRCRNVQPSGRPVPAAPAAMVPSATPRRRGAVCAVILALMIGFMAVAACVIAAPSPPTLASLSGSSRPPQLPDPDRAALVSVTLTRPKWQRWPANGWRSVREQVGKIKDHRGLAN